MAGQKLSDFEIQTALETLVQLFTDGPIWDGNLASKTGRDILVDAGFDKRQSGYQYLTDWGMLKAELLGLFPTKMDKRQGSYIVFCQIRDKLKSDGHLTAEDVLG